MAKSFKCRVITPDGVLLDRPAVSVRYPVDDGLVGILADHAPMITLVGQGALTLRDGEGRVFFVEMTGGFAEVRHNVLTILAEQTGSVVERSPEARLRRLEEARRELAADLEQARAREQSSS